MIKVKALVQFYDKAEKKKRMKDEVFDVTPERFNEIIKKGRYIEAVAEEKPEKA